MSISNSQVYDTFLFIVLEIEPRALYMLSAVPLSYTSSPVTHFY